ncbi:adenosine deaminase 2-A-like [Pieris brassicae]|uniref:adenosine deaminase 2-A-like n=1 Tax=Pieris brassicae TaxID=7116 RepID=UPI001E660053|nr:adenosine deaminase 2-A-like [Pieris brassicae]
MLLKSERNYTNISLFIAMCALIVIFLVAVLVTVESHNEYESALFQRTQLLERELNMMLGNDLELGDAEEQVNEYIMELKRDEVDFGFTHPQHFNYSKHFFDYKDEVQHTQLFKIIKQMPKGALLHAHDTGMLSPDYVVTLTYLENLYVCFEEESVKFLFARELPTTDCSTQWQLMRDARYSSGNVEKFDENLKKYFTLVIDDHSEIYTDINIVWEQFQNYFIRTTDLFTYEPVWEQYFYDTLKALREDNVMYLEIRSVLPGLYDLDGNVYDEMETLASYKRVIDRFSKDYPDFFGAKIIFAPLRSVQPETVKEYLQKAKIMKREYADIFAGFDLVGQEDLGRPIKDFLKELSTEAEDIDFFFHAGETNWYGTSSDENLVDAIVLNARRIGHAFALIKHPVLIEEVKKRNIAIEGNVISNVVLKLVEDMRNHPLASFIAQGLPVVLASDDPGIWGADPLSLDFFVTFVGVASRHADLRLLKKLALNSLYYSTYSNKDKIVHEFDIRWARFIHNIQTNHL